MSGRPILMLPIAIVRYGRQGTSHRYPRRKTSTCSRRRRVCFRARVHLVFRGRHIHRLSTHLLHLHPQPFDLCPQLFRVPTTATASVDRRFTSRRGRGRPWSPHGSSPRAGGTSLRIVWGWNDDWGYDDRRTGGRRKWFDAILIKLTSAAPRG